MNKQPLTVTKLVKPGYPDIQIQQENNRITYLELKTSSVNEKSGFRYFIILVVIKLNQMQDIYF